MKGYMKISEATWGENDGISLDCHITEMNIVDKIAILEATLKAIRVESAEELDMMIFVLKAAKKSNAFNEIKISATPPDEEED